MAQDPSPKILGDFSLKNKIVLITGAGTGINFALCRLAHQQGAKVLIADLKLGEKATEYVNANKDTVKFQQCDVTQWSQLEQLFTTSLSAFGDVPDVTTAGAGVFDPPSSNFWYDREEESYKTLEINVSHVIKLTRLAMRALVGRNKKGVICPIASQAGLMGFYLTPLYCATKHAVVGFVRSLAPAEPQEGIKVVTICPGAVNTNIWGEKREIMKIDDMTKDTILEPEDIAEAMIEIITQGKYPGGSVLEISASNGKNLIPAWNDPSGPNASPLSEAHFSKSAEVPPLFQTAHDMLEQDRKTPFPPIDK